MDSLPPHLPTRAGQRSGEAMNAHQRRRVRRAEVSCRRFWHPEKKCWRHYLNVNRSALVQAHAAEPKEKRHE